MTPFSMRRALPTAALVLSLVPLAMMGDAGGSAVRPKAVVDRKYEVLFKEHCLSCHNEEKRKGSVRLDNLPFEIESVETAERWQKVLNALNSAEMPPEEEKQPDKGVKTDFLEHLAQQMVVARRSIADTGGRITLRRLNQREYKNTLRELLGVDVGVGDLPADGSGTAFDTVGSNLFMSGSQFDSYRQIGRKALDAAFGLYVDPRHRANCASSPKTASTRRWNRWRKFEPRRPMRPIRSIMHGRRSRGLRPPRASVLWMRWMCFTIRRSGTISSHRLWIT
jgi:hypothetical protein